jgi:hypothetical protein
MNRQTAVRVLRGGDVHPNRAEALAASLLQAAREARQFAKSLEIKDDGQRLRYLALADSLTAQANSLRSEVARCWHTA